MGHSDVAEGTVLGMSRRNDALQMSSIYGDLVMPKAIGVPSMKHMHFGPSRHILVKMRQN
jgi:hypothetical protein